MALERLSKILRKKVNLIEITPVNGEEGLVNIQVEIDGESRKIRKTTGWEKKPDETSQGDQGISDKSTTD